MKKPYDVVLRMLAVFALVVICVLIFIVVRQRKDTVADIVPAKFVNLRGLQAPEFTVRTLDGRLHVVPNGKKPVLLEIIATWCSDCRDEVKTVNRFAKTHPNFAVLAVVGDKLGQYQQPETTSDIEAFAHRYHVAYPISTVSRPDVADLYKTWAYPSLIVIRRNGLIEFNIAGNAPYETLAVAAMQAISKNGRQPSSKDPMVFPTP